jgi:putative membrane protein
MLRSPFTPEEHQRIHDAVAAIKRETGADLDLIVTPVSDRYSMYPIVWAALGALTLTGFTVVLWPHLSGQSAILIQMSVLFGLLLLLDWLPIRLRIVPMRVKRAQAHQLAHREFAAHVMTGPSRKRILLFVSIGERYVEIIADHETHALVPDGTWDKIVGDFLTTVKAGRIAEGLLDAIEACRVVLNTSAGNELGRVKGE